MTVAHIGIIAEDDSDVEVLKHLAGKLASHRFTVSKFTGKGCGSLRRKAPGWCLALSHKGCSSVVLVHDRDRHDENVLRGELEEVLRNIKIQLKVVVIPCEELEAWLLSDMKALKQSMNLATMPKIIPNPETTASPKECIGELVRMHSKNKSKRYVNTVHNLQIAKAVSVSTISRRCPSFRYFGRFIAQSVG